MKRSFLIYTAGLSALFLTDFLVSAHFSHQVIADWGRLRSLIGIAAVIPLIGLDQVLVRTRGASAQLLRLLAIQVPALGVLVGLVLAAMGFDLAWWQGASLAISSAVSLILFQYFRSHHHPMLSQLAQQGWKILALALVATMWGTGWAPDLTIWTIGLIAFVDLLVALAVIALPPNKLHPQEPMSVSGHYAIGSRFMVTALLLALSVYAEQLVVNRLGTTAQAALYFTAATYLLFPMSFFNGYLAFIIGPWMRDRHNHFIGLLKSKWMLMLVAAALYAMVLNFGGWLLWIIVHPAVGALDNGLQLAFYLNCLARSLNTVPSGYLGVFGRPAQHDILIVGQLAVLLPVVALYFAIRAFGYDLIHAVAFSSALNSALRTTLGFKIIFVVARHRDEETP